MKSAVFIQARVGSSRLRNKVLLNFHKDQTILDVVISSVLAVFEKREVFLLIPDNSENDRLVESSKKHNIGLLRGSEDDVLKRFYDSATTLKLDGIYRICSDNPFLNIKSLIELKTIEKTDNDYVGFKTKDNKSGVKTHLGLWAEYCSYNALKFGNFNSHEPNYRQNVTEHIYSNQDKFKCFFINKEIDSNTKVRLTLDEPFDYYLLKEIYSHIKKVNYMLDYQLVSEVEKLKVSQLMNSVICRNNK